MSLVRLTDDDEINRAVSIWKKIKEDHKNLADSDVSGILSDSQRDEYIAEFIGVERVQDEFRRLQEGLKLYSKLREVFANYIGRRFAPSVGVKELKLKTRIRFGEALLDQQADFY